MSLDQIINEVNKKYGPGTLVKGSQAKGAYIQRLTTGSFALDIETGGGWAQGKWNEIYGRLSSAKTFIVLKTIAANQELDPNFTAAMIDWEGAFDPSWAVKCGVDLSRLFYCSPEYMEEGLDIARKLIRSNEMPLIVFDSWAAASPEKEYTGEIDDNTVGLRARTGNKFVRLSKSKVDLTKELAEGQSTIIIINQLYQGIGQYVPDQTPGGVQVGYNCLIRIRIRRGDLEQSKDGTVVAQEAKFVVDKNKTFPPKKTGSFWFFTEDQEKGKAGDIWRVGEITDYAVIAGVIKKAGAWYTIPGVEKPVQGEAKVAQWLESHPEEAPRLEELIKKEIIHKGNYEQQGVEETGEDVSEEGEW
jgi:recombination protein RecA